MKKNKIAYTILSLGILILPVSAAKWVEFDTKAYIDVSSIRETGECRGYKHKCYSLWTKYLNQGTENDKKFKDLWYYKNRLLIDCSDRKLIVVDVITYDTKNEAIAQDINNYSIYPIVPESRGELVYNYVCGDSKHVINSPSSPTVPSAPLFPPQGPIQTIQNIDSSIQNNPFTKSIYEYLN